MFPAGKGRVKTKVILRTPESISAHLQGFFAKNNNITTLKEGNSHSANKFLLQNPHQLCVHLVVCIEIWKLKSFLPVWIRKRTVLKEKDLNQNYQSPCTQEIWEFSGSPRATLSICSGMNPGPIIGLSWLLEELRSGPHLFARAHL